MDQLEADAKQNDSKCLVEYSGRVNCSSSVYEDERSWKKSRHHVDLLIQTLKQKITVLKDIRRHLKENKPKNILDSDGSIENASEELFSNEKIDGQNVSIDTDKSVKHVNETNTTNRRNRLPNVKGALDETRKNPLNKTTSQSKAIGESSVVATTMRAINRKLDQETRRTHQHHRGQENRTRNIMRNAKTTAVTKTTTQLPIALITTPSSTTARSRSSVAASTVMFENGVASTAVVKSAITIEASSILGRYDNTSVQSIPATLPNIVEHTTVPYEKPNEAIDEQTRTECYCEPDAEEMWV